MADALSRRAWARVLNFVRSNPLRSRFKEEDVKLGVCEGWEGFIADNQPLDTDPPLVLIDIQAERRSRVASSTIRTRQWARSMLRVHSQDDALV